jgi:hypothetical protein
MTFCDPGAVLVEVRFGDGEVGGAGLHGSRFG